MTNISYKTILKKAKTCKTNIKKEYKNGIDVKWSYYICKSIINPKKDIKKINIDEPPKPQGERVNRVITKENYMTPIKKFVLFVEHEKRLPNFVTIAGMKVRPYVFLGFVAQIIVDGIPARQKLSSDIYIDPRRKHGHATAHGCDNMGQNNGYFCGPHSLQEIIRNLTGKVIPQATLASWAGTTTSGTDHQGLETAIAKAGKTLNVKFTCRWYNLSDLGWNGLAKIIKSKNQDFLIHNLYRKKWGHYEAVNSISGSNVKVQNSLGDSCSKGCYCGYVEDRSTSEFHSYISGISQKSILVVTLT